MNRDLTLKLIDLVGANPELYVRVLRTPPYNQRNADLEIWKSISTSLGVDYALCIATWKRLLSKYRDELQKLKKAHGLKISKSPWFFFDKMHFIDLCGKQYVSIPARHVSKPQESIINRTVNLLNKEIPQEDDILQEAMDDQSIDKEPKYQTSSVGIDNENDVSDAVLRRVKALLEGLDVNNRKKAENHIIGYLCRCQLRVLADQSIDDIHI